MGGHAFKYISTPRISPELYVEAKSRVTKALQQLFFHVTVPYEMPSKVDYGDIDFLVSGPLYPSSLTSTSPFDYQTAVTNIKNALNTPHGRKGFLTEQVMYFAIPAPGQENDGEPEFWVQIDVKVCEFPEMWEWERFILNYASFTKMIGSMIKPLGLTSDTHGLNIRVEGLEGADLEKSMVFLTKDPKAVLKIVGLDRRMKDGGFKTNDEVFEYVASSWVFNPAHFARRLTDRSWIKRLEDSPPANLDFLRRWIPDHYPGYVLPSANYEDLEQWYRQMRIAVKDKTFAMFPAAAQEYYEKRRDYLKEVEEYQLRGLITAAIPVGINGWCDSVLPPTIIMKNSTIPSQTEELNLINPFEMISSDTSNTISTSSSFTTSDGSCDINSDLESSSPPSSFSSVHSGDVALQQVQIPISVVDTPLLLDTLPRNPPIAFTPRPPPESMSPKAKLECLYRWTLFSPDGHIFLAKEPRDKKFIMNWSDAEVEAADLVKWAQEMWWPIWKRQFRTNYVGMWKKRMEKEDKTAESKKLEADKKAAVQREADDKKEKLMSRLAAINKGTEGLIDRDAPKPILFGNTSVKAEV